MPKIKRSTLESRVPIIVERVRTERMPLNITMVGVFGSVLTEKKSPNDIDILLVADKRTPEMELMTTKWREAVLKRHVYTEWLRGRYEDDVITSRLLRRGLKGVHIEIAQMGLEGYISGLAKFKNEKWITPKEFTITFVWTKTWEQRTIGSEEAKLPRESQNLDTPYKNYQKLFLKEELI